MERTEFVLVPGYWLGGWSWDRVRPPLVAAGHRVTPVTLPGLSGEGTGPVTLDDQVDAVAEAVRRSRVKPVLVAHSGAGRIVSGVLDRDPGSVRRAVYVDSGPAADGDAPEAAVPADIDRLELPSWDQLAENGASLDGLSTDDLAAFAARAVPHPTAPGREPIRLTDERRRAVPTTLVACSISSATVLELASAGHPMFAELARLTDLTVVDLPTGHWPMWSRPDDLAAALLDSLGRS